MNTVFVRVIWSRLTASCIDLQKQQQQSPIQRASARHTSNQQPKGHGKGQQCSCESARHARSRVLTAGQKQPNRSRKRRAYLPRATARTLQINNQKVTQKVTEKVSDVSRNCARHAGRTLRVKNNRHYRCYFEYVFKSWW